MKVGDLIVCDQYGIGIIVDAPGASFKAYFYEVGMRRWPGLDNFGISMELISEAR